MGKTCTTCGRHIDPGEGWPNADDSGELCQDDWEKEVDDEWWEMVRLLGEVF